MYDVLAAAGSVAVSGQTKAFDAAKLRAQEQTLLKHANGALEATGTELSVTVYYSYSDLHTLVKTQFVDPEVYGYSGVGSCIIHRRYSRGRGLVYMIVASELVKGLDQFDGMARTELAGVKSIRLIPTLVRQEASLSMRQTSLLTLWDQVKVVQTLTYDRAKELDAMIRAQVKELTANVP